MAMAELKRERDALQEKLKNRITDQSEARKVLLKITDQSEAREALLKITGQLEEALA